MDWTNPDWMPEIGTRVAVNIGMVYETWAFGVVTRKTKKTFTIEVVKKTVVNIRRGVLGTGFIEVEPDWDTQGVGDDLVARYKKCDETRREWRRTPSGWAVIVSRGRYKSHRFIT
jgi:hypothetical protein